MPTECTRIRTGSQVDTGPDRSVPDRHSPLCLFSVTSGSQEWIFCGETLDDMRAWQLALEQARLIIVRSAYTTRPSFPCYINTSPDSLMRQNYLPYGHLPPAYVPALSAGPITFFPSGQQIDSNPYSSMPTHTTAYPGEPLPPLPPPASFHPPSSLDPAVMYAPHQPYQSVPLMPYPRPDGRDVAMGMLAGAAVGTMMWGSPYYWW